MELPCPRGSHPRKQEEATVPLMAITHHYCYHTFFLDMSPYFSPPQSPALEEGVLKNCGHILKLPQHSLEILQGIKNDSRTHPRFCCELSGGVL